MISDSLRRRFGGDRWIPWTFVAFFLVVFAANGAMVYVGFATWTGVATEDAYEKGLAYNGALAAARAQADLGWRPAFGFDAYGPTHGRVALALADRDGHPLTGAGVRARFVRPSHQGHDFELALPEAEAGRYGAEVELPLPGWWEVRVRADRGGRVYRLTERIVAR